MREEFLEPMPDVQINAKLLMGKTSVLCVIVATTADGFRVAVPGVEQYEGDSKITLITRNAVYPVRLVLQEPHVGGYSYRLQRLEATFPSNCRPRISDRFRLYTSSCCAAGLISVITAGYYSIPQPNESIVLANRRSLRHESIGTMSPSIAENDRVPPGISVDNSLALDDDFGNETKPYNSDLKTHSVSMLSINRTVPDHDASVPSATGQANRERSAASSNRKSRRDVPLKNLLEDGRTGRVQPASRELLSWINRSASSDERVAFRLSDAAWVDLQQFEIGLKELSADASSQATDSLRKALFRVSSDLRSPCSISDSPQIFAVASDDAKIYFRKVHGQIELVRVLPIGLSKVTLQ